MLKKIISGGQTGADRAALDVAIKFNIEHGGWIPKDRRTEEGPLPMKYKLNEMETQDYRERTKQNIIDSQGTVIISRGNLTGGSKLTLSFAKVIGRPNCYIDLLNTEEFEAAIILKSFIMENQIQILNVAGPRLSGHPWIYNDVKTVLEVMLYLLFLDTRQDTSVKAYIPEEPVKESFPQTMEQAVDLLCDDLPLKTKTFIAKVEFHNIQMLYFPMMEYIRRRVGFDTDNQGLFKDCSDRMEDDVYTVEDAVMLILKQLKFHLEKDHILRVVK
ncbi:MAG: putative molybdenum carrier protein [Proteobacteria bacterium]|nr:putative molybdenum carrier protein [Pseudomonadota bacterium]MBU1585883.1 putative molybdenum carrier protein [Pseudomonadota bacterium]MBU2454669.1 putative molybdenum carrier protein [Pseudomonadota bacterium]MBU2627960.1 putative molybdenum carrier protein [Pseudomonadota bacterium]